MLILDFLQSNFGKPDKFVEAVWSVTIALHRVLIKISLIIYFFIEKFKVSS